MKVGFYVGRMNPQTGGGFNFQESLARALPTIESRHDISFLFHGTSPRESDENAWIDVDAFVRRRKTLWSRIARKGARALRLRPLAGTTREDSVRLACAAHDLDVVWFLTPGYRRVDVPYVCTVWDLQHRLNPAFPEFNSTGWSWEAREAHYKTALRRATRVVTGTERGRHEIAHLYAVAEENIEVVPFFVPYFALNPNEVLTEEAQERLRARHRVLAEKPFLFYPAQFWPHKNHIRVLEALKRLKADAGADLAAVFCGADRGNLGYVRSAAERMGLTDSVHTLGFVSTEEILFLYRTCHCLVFPSYFGPDNIPPLEAMALGCPVAAARIPGSQEQLGDAAVYFDPASTGELAEAILSIGDNGSPVRRGLVSRGHDLANARSPEAYARRVVEILDRLAEQRACWAAGQSYRNA